MTSFVQWCTKDGQLLFDVPWAKIVGEPMEIAPSIERALKLLRGVGVCDDDRVLIDEHNQSGGHGDGERHPFTVTQAVTRLRLLIAFWTACVLAGFGLTFRYAVRGGDVDAPAASWPAASGLHRSATRPTLVMFVHPKCPCSRASLSELNRLLRRVAGRADAIVVRVRPRGLEPGQDEVAALDAPTIRVDDTDGAEAARFGAATSGMTYLYDGAGRLMFSGGLTASRGHEGESFGGKRIEALLQDDVVDRRDAPVFGCRLSERERTVL